MLNPITGVGSALVFATVLSGVSYAQTLRPTTPPASAPATPPTYSFTTFDVPDAICTGVTGINDDGAIFGGYRDSTFGSHGFVYDNGNLTTIDYMLGGDTGVSGINGSGTIVGNEVFGTKGFHAAFIYEAGTFTTVGVPSTSGPNVSGINNDGKVVGSYFLRGDGFVYDNGTFTTIEVPEATTTTAAGINDYGAIVGSYDDSLGTHGFIASLTCDSVADGSVALQNLLAKPTKPDRGSRLPDCGSRHRR